LRTAAVLAAKQRGRQGDEYLEAGRRFVATIARPASGAPIKRRLSTAGAAGFRHPWIGEAASLDMSKHLVN